MSDRSQGPEPGTPEYDWLYGGSKAPQDDDATEVIPASNNPQSQRPPQPGNRPNGPGDAGRSQVMPAQPSPQQPHRQPPPPAAPPRQTGGAGAAAARAVRARGRAARSVPLRWILALLLLWLVFLVAVPLWAW